MDINIHNVIGVLNGKVQEHTAGHRIFYVKDFEVKDERGNCFTIKLFSDRAENLSLK